jgi:tRNA (guanine37-N1)-methyltransferase
MVVMDSVSRLLPGVLGSEQSAEDDSFSNFLLEYPQYTRPFDFRGHCVPDVLLSGNHSEISFWRRREALKRTLTRRPDLLTKAHLSEKDEELLGEMARHLKTGTGGNGV